MVIRKITDTGTTTRAGLPSANPTTSYWLHDPSPALLGHRSTADLPETADVVIVGSGITGAFAARFLKEREDQGKRVVMLEAREACWGATGRNGGHCQPLVYASAPAVAAFELEVFRFLEELVKEEGIDCDWVSLTGVHAFFSQGMFKLAAAQVERLERSHPELAAQIEVISPVGGTGKETLVSLRVPSADGVIIQKKAASLWPYKLVASILEKLLAKFPAPSFNLQTNTPVTSLSRPESGSGWILSTTRGNIAAPQVILATNGYTSHLLPAFADLIVPVRGQIGALIPPSSPTPPSPSDGSNPPAPPAKLVHSYVFAADPDPHSAAPTAPRDDYLVQRPLPGGELIFGGGRREARGFGVGEWADDELEEAVAGYLRGNLAPVLDLRRIAGGGGDDARRGTAEGDELQASFEWTGIMGYSRDAHAWVGPVPEHLGGGDGLWICAGFTGHGMPAAALSAREVVRQMTGRGGADGAEVGLPDEFRLSEERVSRARAMPRLAAGWEATNFATLVSAARFQ
ncbi:tRNA 5-methylaminomethyl-2-thiouridine biosynthesis bifunctional protein MnmC [Madurella mycetomatis]|uniref:tRNA 5-methylaminomethyl-2-thiouridine biosynthesis bifunctional protein MnmC n=1 Tax=Madurella mycetomatis TaxID=100816 RepID=A0A175WGY7_9PEZI|nr:tRNA 5-methylaminomethyl-2-thiouridine biosynthesis bifunctional protein MnmC [Madurella mycetomatis]